MTDAATEKGMDNVISRFFAVPGALFLRWADALGETFLFLVVVLLQLFVLLILFLKVVRHL